MELTDALKSLLIDTAKQLNRAGQRGWTFRRTSPGGDLDSSRQCHHRADGIDIRATLRR